jgi:glycogen(starch) synthase
MDYVMLFRAMRSLINDRYSLRLVIIGGIPSKSRKNARLDSGYREKVNALAEKLAISESLSYTGYLSASEVSAYLSASDLCVQLYWMGISNRHGTFPAILAHGLPAITTLGDEKPEGLVDRHNVIFVPCGDAKALTVALGELIDSPTLRLKIGQNALRLFHERYDWHIIAERIRELYDYSFKRTRKKKDDIRE